MRRNRGLTVVEAIVIMVCLVLLYFLLRPGLSGPKRDAIKVRCQVNLSQIAKAMNMYLNRYGNSNMYALPAQSFRGDCWLAELYWSRVVKEPKVFLCPGTDDCGVIPEFRPQNLALGSAVPPDAISYAGLCKGLTGRFAHRNARSFVEAEIGAASALACDDNEGTPNHKDGMHVVYFDSHVEFMPGTKAETYDLIGAKRSAYECLDSGEE